MTRVLPILLLGACQPMMTGPLPLPLAADTTSTIELSAASPSGERLREQARPALDDPPVPQVQILAASTFSLTEVVEAGPTFLLDLGEGGEPGVVTGGLFVRVWTTEEDADILAAVRAEAGWAWLGVGLDLVLPMTEESFVALGPTVLATPEMVSGRLPLGVYLRLEPIDIGLEGGVAAGLGFDRTSGTALLPWLGLRVRLSL